MHLILSIISAPAHLSDRLGAWCHHWQMPITEFLHPAIWFAHECWAWGKWGTVQCTLWHSWKKAKEWMVSG